MSSLTTDRINGRALSPPEPVKSKDAPRVAEANAKPNPTPTATPTVIVHPVPPRLAPYVSKAKGTLLVISHAPIHLTGLHVINLASATRYVQLFDQSEKPKEGARPDRLWTLPADSELDWDDANGRFFPGGAIVVLSTTRLTLTTVTADEGQFDATFHRAEV